jgi:hypothetical protein
MSNVHKNKLIAKVHDKNLIDYYYLNYSVEELVDKLHSLKFSLSSDKSIVPFNAQLRDYKGAIDSDNNYWIVKKIDRSEILEHLLMEVAYYIDFMLETLAVPSMLINIDGTFYRASKIVLNSIQISSYNYLQSPFLKVLTNDLINRWLFFDEDRNPNNYMVIHNSKNERLIVAIDYNKTDLLTKEMKIIGDKEKFGWFRQEKTRFLTLLKPSNFENLTIDNFEYRLKLLMNLDFEKLKNIMQKLFKGLVDDCEEKCQLVINNLEFRRKYINDYFRKWFKGKIEKKTKTNKSDYSGLGKAFLKMYEKRDND